MKYTFGKNKKLKSRKSIEQLFIGGQSMAKFPVRMVYTVNQDNNENKVAVSVSKKKFKHAVDRNKIKRQLREAYRLNQHELSENKNHFDIMFIYTTHKKYEYEVIGNAVKALLQKLNSSSGFAADENISKG